MTEEFQTIRNQMINILTEAFAPSFLDVIDDSHKHIGHAGHNGKGESHFRIKIASLAFAGKSRIQGHQMIYEALKPLMPSIHALQIIASSSL